MTKTYQKYSWGTAQEAAKHTGENYERYFVPAIGVPSARPVIEAAAIREGERVVDVGCGTGVATRLASEKTGAGSTVVGVDPTPPMLAAARRTSTDIEWLEGSAEDLPLEDATFDVAVSSLSIQFFPDKAQALREIYRVLVPGGRIALGTPGPTPPLMNAIDGALIEHIGPEASKFVQGVFSLHDPTKVRAMLEAAGFNDISTKTLPLVLRVPQPADFFWQYVSSTPLASIAIELDDDTREALENDVVKRCQPYIDGDTLVMELDLLIATARRP